MVFGVLGIFDGIQLVFILICIFLGLYGDDKDSGKQVGASMSNRLTDIEGDKGFGDQFPEVPF